MIAPDSYAVPRDALSRTFLCRIERHNNRVVYTRMLPNAALFIQHPTEPFIPFWLISHKYESKSSTPRDAVELAYHI